MKGTESGANGARVLALVAFAIAALAAAGCSGTMQSGGMPAKDGAMTASMNTSMASSGAMAEDDTPDPNAQVCASCATGKKAVKTQGTVETSDGTQIVAVSIKDGTYSPNRFVAKVGTPTTVVFTVDGKDAKGCLANPTFKSLNKTMSVKTGEKSLELGTLPAGTYEFACEMGMNMGQIVLE